MSTPVFVSSRPGSHLRYSFVSLGFARHDLRGDFPKSPCAEPFVRLHWKSAVLTIRKEQMRALESSMLQRFEVRMAGHLKRFFRDHCHALEEAQIRSAIQHGMERAKTYGIVTERNICKYLNRMFIFGRDFDSEPQMPWAAEILTSGSVPLKRMERFSRVALERGV